MGGVGKEKDEEAEAEGGEGFVPAQPGGEGDYVVQPGDCMSSIAEASGHFWKTLWALPANAALKTARGDPNTLLPGDQVTVPPLRDKGVKVVTTRRHRFRRRGVPEKLRIVLMDDDGQPRRGVKYVLTIDGRKVEGEASAEGLLEAWIPPGARRGTLKIAKDPELSLDLGYLEPVDSYRGAAARLQNLGFLGEGDAASFHRALELFQNYHDLEPTGDLDDLTQKKLVEIHGS